MLCKFKLGVLLATMIFLWPVSSHAAVQDSSLVKQLCDKIPPDDKGNHFE